MKKSLFIFAVLACCVTMREATAQTSFNHSFGAMYARSNQFDYRVDGVRHEGRLSGIGVVYAPRLNLFEIGYNSSFSVSTRLGAGLAFDGGAGNGTNQATGRSLMFDVPLMFDFNNGTASVYDNDQPLGWYMGLGVGINYMSNGEFIRFYTGSYGPIVNGGLRFNVNENYLDLRASYLLDINQAEISIFTLGLSYYLGMRTYY